MSAPPKWLLIHSDTEYKDPAGAENGDSARRINITRRHHLQSPLQLRNRKRHCLFLSRMALDAGCR